MKRDPTNPDTTRSGRWKDAQACILALEVVEAALSALNIVFDLFQNQDDFLGTAIPISTVRPLSWVFGFVASLAAVAPAHAQASLPARGMLAAAPN
jgi:hypothetical protein